MGQPYHLVSAASTNKTLVRKKGALITSWSCVNKAATLSTVQLYDAAADTDVTVGTTVPSYSIVVPGNATANMGDGNNASLKDPMQFSLGLVIATISGMQDTGNTAVGAGDLNINMVIS